MTVETGPSDSFFLENVRYLHCNIGKQGKKDRFPNLPLIVCRNSVYEAQVTVAARSITTGNVIVPETEINKKLAETVVVKSGTLAPSATLLKYTIWPAVSWASTVTTISEVTSEVASVIVISQS